jgi:dTDP-4-dehydrorhamnose reductase
MITGCRGLLGQNLIRALHGRCRVIGADLLPQASPPLAGMYEHRILDITDRDGVAAFLRDAKPDWIINTAAVTNVDGCEVDPEGTYTVNTRAVEHLLDAKSKTCRLAQISTDYVFDGDAGPYDEKDPVRPLGVYGASKWEAEELVRRQGGDNLIIRIMVLWGSGWQVRPNFFDYVLSQLRKNSPLRIVTDQTGNTALASSLAANIAILLTQGAIGLYHLADGEICSRYDFAVRVAEFYRLDPGLVRPGVTADLKQKARRPLRSGFTLEKARRVPGIRLPDLHEQLKQYEKEKGLWETKL